MQRWHQQGWVGSGQQHRRSCGGSAVRCQRRAGAAGTRRSCCEQSGRCCQAFVSSPHTNPSIHHSSTPCSVLPRSLPTHKHKVPPYAVPMLTSSSCFPTLPRCWLTASGSSNPPRLFYPLALALGPYFQPPIIFSALLSSKPRVNRGNLGHSLPSTPSCRTSISSSLLNAPGSQH